MNTTKFLNIQNSETTQKQYTSVLKLYELYCTETASNWNSIDTVQGYLGYLKRSKVSMNTIKNRLACIRAFFHWNKIAVDNFPIPKGDDSTPTDGLSDEEARKLIDCIDDKMHSALIHLMLFTGIRCSEARSVQFGSIRQDGEFYVLTIIGKGNKIRMIGLQPIVFEKIMAVKNAYARVDMRGKGEEVSNLFVFSKDGKNPIHQNTIANIIKRYVKKAGITKNISPHSLRVTCVSNVIQSGAPLPTVMELGGWASLDMVLRYDRRSKLIQNSAALRVKY